MCDQPLDPFEAEISRQVWRAKYRHDGEAGIADSWRRIARAIAQAEPDGRTGWAQRFETALRDFAFLPGGRIQAGAGTGHEVTLFNCFVMPTIEDSIDGIFAALHDGAVTMQHGGGVGYDFSTLRPAGTVAERTGSIASGPVSFMAIWDAMCATMMSTGARRGAMMATLRCDHPDIETFIAAKQTPGALRNFNLSVQVTDDFVAAVRADAEWPLVFPVDGTASADTTITRHWPGNPGPVPCTVHRRIPARRLWDRIMRATYDNAEPGILFVDRINRENNLAYRERITATNPCGEIPLPPNGACDLGAINLPRFVRGAYSRDAHLDLDAIRDIAATATRFLDNVIDISRFPLAAQRAEAQGARRIGLGITGLADALIMLGLEYGGEASLDLAETAMRTIRDAAYRTSATLAREKGPFPHFARDAYLAAPFVARLPVDIRDAIARDGIRNSHLTAIAPAGTISLLANNVSSGLEPVFAARYRRRVLDRDSFAREFELVDCALARWQGMHGADAGLPPAFVTAEAVSPDAQLSMQAALQRHVDNAISKTVYVPRNTSFEAFKDIYMRAYELGLKGCTTFRPNPVTGEILSATAADASHCCGIEREAD